MAKNKTIKGRRNRTKRKSIKRAKIISKRKYSQLIKKKKSKKRMKKMDKKKLERALFINYCKCIKKLKYSKKYKKGIEYPICMSSVYKKRGFIPPKHISNQCRKYR